MMMNLDPRQEQQLADELDALLTAHLHKRPLPPINPAVAGEAQLAQALLSLAAMIEPDAHFLSTLERRLSAAAHPSAAKPKGTTPSVWQQISDTIKEGFAMKRIGFALATLFVLFGLGYAVWTFWGGLPGVGPEPVAEQPADSGSAVAEIDPASLPPLPALGSGAQGLGGGGAGGGDGRMAGVTETMAEAPMPVEPDGGIGDDLVIMPWNPLADAAFDLTIDLPNEAGTAAVFDLTMGGAYAEAEAIELARRFGFSGPLYREVYPVFEPFEGEEEMWAWTPPVSYNAFDGERSLWIGEGYLHYNDAGAEPQAGQMPMAHEQARPIAEAFLQERGLLDFEYDISHYGGYEVIFTRQINGRTSTHAQLYVSVGPNGQVSMVSYSPLRELTSLADYPIRSAADAWALLLELAQEEDFDFQRVFYNTYPGPGYVDPYQNNTDEWSEHYRYWERTYQVGQTITIYPHLMAFEPVGADVAPRIQADRFLLDGDANLLREMIDVIGRQVQVTGVVSQLGPRPVLELLGWEALPEDEYRYTYSEGISQREGEQVFVITDEGEQILLPDAPADLEDGVRISVSGWSIDSGDGPYPTFNWQGLGLIYDEPFDYPDPYSELDEDPFKISQITIDEVELVYVITSTYDEVERVPHFMAQPAWRFKGSTNTNMIIELTVQAVEDAYIATP
jgi:hypothetical protein